jgi:hypothetical protein
MFSDVAVLVLAVCIGSPPDPNNASFACGSSTLASASCVASCASGFQAGPGGPPTASCGDTGLWSLVTGSCVQTGELKATYVHGIL